MGTRITQLPPKGANLGSSDLLLISEPVFSDFESKSITGAEIIASAQTGMQPELVSGTNIKTINSTSLLGSGNVAVQPTLVSGTNIKTINGNSLLGTGDLVVGGGLTIGTTAITSGTVGRVLFEGTGNVVQESANLFWNNTSSRLGIGTASPLALLHTTGSVTASGAIARGNFIQPTLVAAANNDTLVGLDIAPTFTNGSFTGVTNLGLRVSGNIRVDGVNSSAYAFSVYSSNTLRFGVVGFGGVEMPNGFNVVSSSTDLTTTRLRIGTSNATAPINIQAQSGNTDMIVLKASSGVDLFTIKNSTGNALIGTSTDAGYKLDVNGTARVQGKLSVNTPTATSAVMEVTSTTQGFLPPRMTNAQMVAIATPASGLMVYDTTNNKMCVYDGTAWQNLY